MNNQISSKENSKSQDILTPFYHAKKINKFFKKGDKVEILKDLDLEIKKGETIAIVGASGVGKTTLLNILGTLEKPSSGHLLFKGQEVFTKSPNALSRFRNKTVGFVFQFHHLLPEFSALENIMMPGLIAGKNSASLKKDSRNLLSQIGLANREKHKIGELSGGEQQRVAIARALVMRPSLLLADEPTGNLDPKTGQHVFELITEMNTLLSLATVIVTHNLQLAAKMDRCLTLIDGKLHE